MALPEGVTTALITMGNVVSFSGQPVRRVHLEITPVLPDDVDHLVHWASGWKLEPITETFEIDYTTGTLSFTLPHVDQAGFRDQHNNEVSMWSYHAVIKVILGVNEVRSYERDFQVLTSQETLDIDTLSSGPIQPIVRGTYVQPTPPVFAGGTGLWVQTGLGPEGDDFTIWFEDGQ